MKTLYSSVIKLTNQHPVTLSHIGGQHAHAAFLDILREVDPALSQKVHDLNGRKPFTVSPVMGLPKHMDSEVWLRSGWECWLRVTMLDDALFNPFIKYFMNLDNKKLPEIRLGDARFLVSEILTTPGSHPWAGYTTLEELQKRLDQPAPSSISFELHSPTSFKLDGKDFEVIPYSKMVFGNLATAWKALTGENMVEAVEKYAEKNWRPLLHRVERKALTLHNHPQVGAVGKVEYQNMNQDDAPLARAMNLLADLAFYAGLGRKTTQGMGMCSRVTA